VDDFEGESVWRLADIEVSSTKTEVCDCKRKKQFDIDISAIIKKGDDFNKSAKLQGAVLTRSYLATIHNATLNLWFLIPCIYCTLNSTYLNVLCLRCLVAF
jgi:hypothetical protein